ncbi:hypothetical protein SAMN04488104_10921 [Algoriphagus faecimaris]|uniref:Uncharacterized protein n=1 Tax=Algoriphagus faecimaris TaxID=686796 RepID=A0A1G6YBF3_9BACT|nr:hypothetical protein SAMN04488104_10921 [Algoriphagus faecimaris]
MKKLSLEMLRLSTNEILGRDQMRKMGVLPVAIP